eukprot:CAMPEP_0119539464 /NCGR_PEP_ID=MMETSP1344-20130328/51608_1 /TAXON_ID=236787 /ORGANISM="Florenciella parvula, Strain CCMP2471" /LENGTH=42 /DNA_ID= /DNA_START= /DNA_END= /DNA_ORIENTATION=
MEGDARMERYGRQVRDGRKVLNGGDISTSPSRVGGNMGKRPR